MNREEIQYIKDLAFAPQGVCGSLPDKDKHTKQIIFNDAFEAASDWYEQCPVGSVFYPRLGKMRTSHLRKACKKYIYANANFTNKPAGFLPSFVWWWLAKLVVNWIIDKIIKHLMDKYKT